MKNIFRQIVGLITVGPIVMMTYLFSVFIGKERAIRFWGPSLTRIAKMALKYFIPEIKDASEFYLFSVRMKKKFWLWRPLYDFYVEQEDKEVFKLHISNCPFCESIFKLGLPEMASYVCQGDWEVAKENKNKWEFNREYEIGKGDTFCDHTYLSKNRKTRHVT